MVYNYLMCGIIGIVDDSFVNQSLFDGLTVLQHRGQDSAGIATCHSNNLYQKKLKGSLMIFLMSMICLISKVI